MKSRLNGLRCQMELIGVLTREIPTRLIEISRSGCLLESGHRIEEGTVGALAARSRRPELPRGCPRDAVRGNCRIGVRVSRGRGVPADGQGGWGVDSAGGIRIAR